MAKKIKKKFKLPIVIYLLIGFFLLLLFYFIFLNKQVRNQYINKISSQGSIISPTILEQNYIYHSEFLKISMEVPKDMKLIEQNGDIILNKQGGTEEIILSGIGTNYDDIDGFLLGLEKRNNSKISDKKYLIVSGLDAVEAYINGQKHYLIYNDHWVYSITTEKPTLYPLLDQIARSFRYEP